MIRSMFIFIINVKTLMFLMRKDRNEKSFSGFIYILFCCKA